MKRHAISPRPAADAARRAEGGGGWQGTHAQQPGAAPLRPTDVIGAFFLAGVLFIVAGSVVAVADAIDPWRWGRWLALHLIFIGGLSQLILGASQFFAGAFLATDPPPRGLIRAQFVTWNVGAIYLAAAVPWGVEAFVATGAALLVVSLALYVAGFAAMRRRALNTAPWASRWYVTGAAFLAVGVVAGVTLANGYRWQHGDLLGAHMALNLGGWLGVAIVGTLHTFYPSLTRTQLQLPRLQAPTFAAWCGGVAALALGYGLAVDRLAVAGWIMLCVAAALLFANVGAAVAAARVPLALPARLVGAAQFFLLAGALVAAAAAVGSGPAHALAGPTRAAVAALLLAGWIGLTVAGSMLHLLALLNRVRDPIRGLPDDHRLRDGAIAAAAVAAIALLALAHLLELDTLIEVAVIAVACVYAGLGGRLATLAGRAALNARPRI